MSNILILSEKYPPDPGGLDGAVERLIWVFSRPGFSGDLIASKLNHLRVSLDGATPESYQVYRVGGRFATIVEGVRDLQERKRWLGRDCPVPGSDW